MTKISFLPSPLGEIPSGICKQLEISTLALSSLLEESLSISERLFKIATFNKLIEETTCTVICKVAFSFGIKLGIVHIKEDSSNPPILETAEINS